MKAKKQLRKDFTQSFSHTNPPPDTNPPTPTSVISKGIVMSESRKVYTEGYQPMEAPSAGTTPSQGGSAVQVMAGKLLDRQKLIAEANTILTRLLRDTCPMCAADEPVICEIIDGVSQHIVGGNCLGSPIRNLMRHLDDVRDQFANEFNEANTPRAKWVRKNA